MTDVLKGETIVYFGPDRWAGLWRNRHQLMSRFARHNDVWYVEPPVTLRRLAGRGKGRHGPEGPRPTRLYTRDPSGVVVFHGPWWLPVTGRHPFKHASLRVYLAVLSLAARRDGRDPIVWLSRPAMIDYLGRVASRLTIYHVVDEYSGYGSASDEERAAVAEREAGLLRRVDAVIVVTRTLLRSKSPHNPNTFHVPNAVDFTAYSSAALPVPDDMAALRGPVIGYSGLIAARLDLELVAAAAEARPDWSFVFVGLVREDECTASIARLRALANVHFLGRKTVHETPAYVQRFDIGMIPYALNLRARHASPLKLYEYAAASKPIVATDFTAARDFEGHVEIVRSRDELLNACERGLAATGDSPSIIANRRFAADNTWERRVEQISGIIKNCTRRQA